ncbi:MAG: glycoside hydrolase family 1 [Cyanobacteria bacterium RYN_339]|nr:glycoside hydrolase family 1 [Cyanobacteria bacterium RYN_339]
MLNRLEKLAVTLTTIAAMTMTGCGKVSPNGAANRLMGSASAASKANGFLWGVSTAGYQYEGNDNTSNWAAWDKAGKTVERNLKAADGLHMYKTDIELTQGLGCNAFRTSIEWGRIEPVEGTIDPQAVAYYHDMLREMHAHGQTPVITLHHFSHPQWVAEQGGWENKETAQKFARFAGFCAKEFGADVDTWLTFNEPNVYLAGAYLAGGMPPGKKNPIAAFIATKNLIKGHKLAYAAIHANDSNAKVSFNWYTAEWALRSVMADNNQTEGEKAIGSDNWMLDEAVKSDDNGGRTLDFVAIDYYCKLSVANVLNLPRQDKWTVYPEGMYNALKRFNKRYNLPVLVAENGVATWDHTKRADGWNRASYTVAHVAQMQRAINEGVPVMGYIQWSITDNYEWGTFSPCFGLYRVECRNQNFTRVPTEGVQAFKDIIANGGTNQAMLAKYLPGTTGGINIPVPVAGNGSHGSSVNGW